MRIFRGVAGALALLTLAGCTHLFYHPSQVMYVSNPEKLEGIREEISFASGDGTQLAGWWLKAKQQAALGTVVQFHGNAQNMTSHFVSMLWMTERGYDLMAFDYRGYGISEGKPSQEGVNRDALAAIRYALGRMRQKPSVAAHKLTLYGQSLGGAILMRALDELTAEERAQVRAVVIESSFHSYKTVAADVLSRSWLTFLLQPLGYVLVSNSYAPEDSIPRISPLPLLVIHGDRDPVVPLRFGRKIFALAREPKQFVLVPEGGHLEASPEATAAKEQQVVEFLSGARNGT